MSFQTCRSFLRVLNTKEDMPVAIDFYSTEEKNTVEVNGYQQLFCNQHSSKYILLRKETHAGLKQIEGE